MQRQRIVMYKIKWKLKYLLMCTNKFRFLDDLCLGNLGNQECMHA